MSDAVVTARGLELRYPGGVQALSGFDVDIPRGSVGLVGANGAGKTSFFRLVLGLSFPRPRARSRSSATP